jgi:Transport protein Avl9
LKKLSSEKRSSLFVLHRQWRRKDKFCNIDQQVIGFHHKKGCIVEYAYPPLIPGGSSDSNELPSQWKHLPSLALPDGSHNFDSDTAYFHLPDLENPRKTSENHDRYHYRYRLRFSKLRFK